MACVMIKLVPYSEKSVAVFGDTKELKQELKSLGGRYNKNLTDPENGNKAQGWIFSVKKKELIERKLSIHIQEKPVEKQVEKPIEKQVKKPVEKQVEKLITQQSKNIDALSKAIEEGLSEELAGKYNDYYVKKIKIQKTGRSSEKRDASRSKVYDAEGKFRAKFPMIVEIITEEEAIKFFDEVIQSDLYKELSNNNYPRLVIKDVIKASKLKGKYAAGQATQSCVELSRECGLKKATILHELSHTCGNLHHDIKFREDEIKLVKEFFGNKYAAELNRCFKSNNLKTKVPNKIMEPQEWFKNYEKITNARKLKK